MATIKEVARHAGVSIATVSNYLNHTKPVSRATATRIKQAIKALDYSQNLYARSLKSNDYTDIGVIFPNFNDSYYVQVFQGIEAILQNSPYYLNLAFTYDIPELEQEIVKGMLRKQVCALFLVTCQPENKKFYEENFIQQGKPIQLLDRAIAELHTGLITFDNHAAMQDITQTLLTQGHRKLALLAGDPQFTNEFSCIQGFLDAHHQMGVQPIPDAVRHIQLDKEAAFLATLQLLRQYTPSAILATSELTATGIAEGLQVLGYTIRDIPVITLGEEHWNKFTQSFASQSRPRPAAKLGSHAARMLLDSLRNSKPPAELILPYSKPVEISVPFRRSATTTSQPLRILMLDTPIVHIFCNLVRNFEMQTGIRTEIQLLPHHILYNTIVSSSQSSDCDVCMYDLPWLPLLASQGILADLTQQLSTMDTSIFLPDSLQYYSQFKNGFYGLPLLYAPQILYYRKDLFEDPAISSAFEKRHGVALRPPLTFEEFNTVGAFFTQHTTAVRYGFSIPAAYSECLAPELYMRLRAYGCDVLDKQGLAVLDNPQTLKAYQNFQQAITVAKPDFLTATDTSIVEDFANGETAMLISYPSFLTHSFKLQKRSMLGSIGCTHIPGRHCLLGGWSLGVSSHSTQPDAAFSFVQWMCGQQMGNYFGLLGGQSAVTSTYDNDELVKLSPWLPLYLNAYQYAQPMLPFSLPDGRVPAPTSVDEIVCRWAHDMAIGKCSAEQAIVATQTDLEAFLSQKPDDSQVIALDTLPY